MKKLILLLPLLAFIVYFLTTNGVTPFNHFTLLANAFLKGKLYISAIAPWLEKIPIDKNNFYVANPPGPAILAIPFVLIFGKDFPQNYIAYMVGAGITFSSMLLAKKIHNDKKTILWVGILAGFGTITWFMSSVGSTWYLGQLVADLFLTFALVESFSKKRVWIIGILLGFAYLSRIHTILSLPLFLYLLKDKFRKIDNIFLFIISLGTFILLNAFYNYARFGVFWDKGYLLIAGVLNEPWYSKGIINPAYILNNLRVFLMSFPVFTNTPPFIKPSWGGLAIWITTPAFIFAFFAPFKETLVKFSWLTTILIAIFVFMHGDPGYAQFGYRFAVDFYPFLMLLTIKGVERTGIKKIHWILLLIGVVINLWGVILINKLNWVGP